MMTKSPLTMKLALSMTLSEFVLRLLVASKGNRGEMPHQREFLSQLLDVSRSGYSEMFRQQAEHYKLSGRGQDLKQTMRMYLKVHTAQELLPQPLVIEKSNRGKILHQCHLSHLLAISKSSLTKLFR